MSTHSATAALALALVLAIGCNKSDQSAQPAATPPIAPSMAAAPTVNSGAPASNSDSDLIRQAVEDHLRNNHGINMSAMDMSVDSVSVNGDQAQAMATFRLKQGGTGMAMTYSLERHANGWLVVTSPPSGGQIVYPPMDKTHSGTGASPSAPTVPDVADFLKNHPAPNKN